MTKSTLDISVAISTRDRPDPLHRCLESLREGNALPAEIVVADQSESEATRLVVEQAANDGLPVGYLRARPGGLGAAQNDAFTATSSAVVAVLDDDCVADEDWLVEIAHAFEADPGLALVGGRVLPFGPEVSGTYAVSSRASADRRVFSGKAEPWDVGSGNNFALRREWFDRVGGCNEQLGPGAPLRGGLDMDLFYRVLRAGGRACYEPAVLVLHERTTREGRLSRRSAYGFGMAAAIAIWLRERDRFAWRILGSWILMRTSLLLRALARRRWHAVHEEALVLWGTVQGLMQGLLRNPGEQSTT
jgi:GT2 family glycosyltransferase